MPAKEKKNVSKKKTKRDARKRKQKEEHSQNKPETASFKLRNIFCNVQKSVESKTGIKVSLEKAFWIMIALIIFFPFKSFVLGAFGLSSDNSFDTQIYIGAFWINLSCTAQNTDLITEDSKMRCNTVAKHRLSSEVEQLDIIIRAHNIDDKSTVAWHCNPQIKNVVNTSFSNPVSCKELFEPRVSGIYSFELYDLDHSGIGDPYGNGSFDDNLTVLSQKDADDMQIAKCGLMLAFVFGILFFLFELRRFLRD
ncbi:MAG: hypothetical protein KAJ91_04400 [Candidatus Aenigmarchaeota archaeon]|nr:hypothetical protein [Candidatus Aenigmarchaeota archaeon]